MYSVSPYRRDLAKTFSFLALHFVVGFSVAYAFTGEVAIATGIALVEPLANAFVFFFHERAWRREISWIDYLVDCCTPSRDQASTSTPSSAPLYKRDLGKTFSFLALHFLVGFTVAFIFTGEVAIASAIALVEPLANAVVFFFHERVWRGQFTFSDFLAQRGSPESEFAPTEEEIEEVTRAPERTPHAPES